MRRGIIVLIGLFLWPVVAFGQLPQVQPMHTFQSAAAAEGDGTAIAVQGWATLGVQVVISNTATVTFESTVDGTNWVSNVCASVANTAGTLTTTASASGVYLCNIAGMSQFRVRVSSWSSGTVTAKGLATLAGGGGGGGIGGGGDAGAVVDTDDGSVAGGQETVAVITEDHNWSGSAWIRSLGDATDGKYVRPPFSKAEDTAHSDGDKLAAIGARRIDTPATSAGTSGDYATVNQSAEGGTWTTLTPSASGGTSIFRSIDLDETEEEIKATAGTVCGMWVTNTATTTRWIKFYDATAANVTVGTTTPVITIAIPGNSVGDDVSGSFAVGSNGCVGFSTAITVAATTGVADNDTGAPGSNEVIVNVFYK